EDTIVQRAINGLKINRRVADFRATVQRNGSGEIEINSIAARIANIGSPITSTRTGSLCYRFNEFCELFLHYTYPEIERLNREVEQFLLDIYRCLENSYGGFAEVGIDFAIDKKRKIWLIECNAKPAKSALFQAYDQETIRRAFRNPLNYAKHISGF